MAATALFLLSVVALLVVSGARHRLPSPRRPLAEAVAPLSLLLAVVLTGDGLLVQKWLARLALPVGLVGLALVGASAWLLRQRRWREASAAIALMALYWLAGNVWVGSRLLRVLEAAYVAPRPPPAEPYEALLLLGGGLSVRPSGEIELGPSGDRVATAARAFHRGLAERIVCTGHRAKARPSRGRVEGVPALADGSARDTTVVLSELGVPVSAIVEIDGPRNTSEEIAAFSELARARGWQRLGLVTSAWHMRRALALARRAALHFDPLPADFRARRHAITILEAVPDARGLEDSRLALWELFGALVGR